MGERLLNITQVEEKISFKKSFIYQGVADKTFPQPIRMGARCTRWKESDIDQWIERIAANNEENQE